MYLLCQRLHLRFAQHRVVVAWHSLIMYLPGKLVPAIGYFHLLPRCERAGSIEGDLTAIWPGSVGAESLDVIFEGQEQALNIACIYASRQDIGPLCIQQELL